MKSIFIKDKNFTPLPEPVCAAIGNFDGVHLGHQKLIEECKRHNLKSAVVTFYPHPSVFLKKIPDYRLVTPLEHKAEILSRLGLLLSVNPVAPLSNDKQFITLCGVPTPEPPSLKPFISPLA